jgi:circadian clock protein KaiC
VTVQSTRPSATERLSSGHARLDEILHGGLLRNAITLIIGIPGSGKTILGQQFAFHNATVDGPALYLSTVTEPFDKIVRYGQSLDFFDVEAVRKGNVIYEDLGRALTTAGLDGVLAALGEQLKEHRPSLVVIDSFRALHAFAKDDAAYRLFLDALTRQLTASATTTLWIDEYGRANAQEAPEFAVADAIIALDIKQHDDREQRTIQVLKLRGSGFQSGQHAYRLSSKGLNVFPRLADVQDVSSYKLATERLKTGVPALDQMLGDGLWPGASTLVVGPTGVGKTLIGLHFLFEGAKSGQPGILATFQENRTQLGRIVAGFGWSIDAKNLHVLSRSIVDVYIDEWVYELLDLIDSTKAKRVVIDSLPDVMTAAGDPTRFREWMFSLVQRCTRLGISLVMTHEVAELYDIHHVSEQGLSHLSDNVIVLQYAKDTAHVTRTLTVLKTRATYHDHKVRPYEITPEGLTLRDTGP